MVSPSQPQKEDQENVPRSNIADMTIKSEYLVLSIVIIALALYLVLGREDQPGSELPGMTTLDEMAINRMVVTKDAVVRTLVKRDDRWYITPNNYPVDRFKIKNMVKAGAELTLTARVSESSQYARYGLNDDQRIKVQMYKDEQLRREFDIGRAAPSVQHTFVLVAGDTNVYHAKGRLNSTFEVTLDHLRDKTVLSFDKTTIDSLQIKKGDRDRTLYKTEIVDETKKAEAQGATAPDKQTLWQGEDGGPSSQTAIDALLKSISDLKCDAYMPDDAKANLTDAVWTLTLKSDNTAHTLSLFAGEEKDATQYPGVSSFNAFAFLLSKNRVENIEKQIEQLLAPAGE